MFAIEIIHGRASVEATDIIKKMMHSTEIDKQASGIICKKATLKKKGRMETFIAVT